MSGQLQRAIAEARKGRPRDQQVEQAGDRVLEHLRTIGELPGELTGKEQVGELRPIQSRRWLVAATCAGAMLALVVSFFVVSSRQPALARLVEGPLFSADTLQPAAVPGATFGNGGVFRTGKDSGAQVALIPDSSQVEIGPNAEFYFQRVDDGIRIHLSSGGVIVSAAKQAGGHLYVETPDCIASVVGTVFVVRVEKGGSFVSVLEGEVQVRSATKVETVRPGEQVRTNPAMTPVPLQDEISWSRKASTLRALLPPAPTGVSAVAAAAGTAPGVQFTIAPQVQMSGASSIEGIVVRRGTNEPLAGVELELSRVEGTPAAPLAPGVAELFASILYSTGLGLPAQGSAPPALLAPEVKYGKTGSDGKFVFRDLKDGKYRLVAVRGGGAYFPVEFGQRDLMQRGLSFPLVAGEARKDVKLEMTPTGAISGRVVDEDGQPMGHVLVMALAAQERAGELKSEIERVVLTDERGEYRIYWLGPGKYYVAAVYEDPQRRTMELAPQGPPARTITRERATSPVVIRQILPDGSTIEEAYGVVYFGGTVDPRSARTVDVFSGETSGGADIPMGAGKMRVHHIRGVVINGDTGQPAGGVAVVAIPRQPRPNALVLQGTSNADGTFDLAGAFPEGYLLTATIGPVGTGGGSETINAALAFLATIGPGGPGGGSAGGTPQVGYVSLDVAGGDATNVRIVTRSGISVTGRVTIEGKPISDSDADLAKMSVRLTRDPDLIAMPVPLMPLPPLPPQPAGSPPVRRPGNGQVTGNGEFTLFVSPGDFRMNVTGIPANTYVKSMRMGGDDVLRSGLRVTGPVENPLQIVIGVDGGTITGSVVDESLRPFTNATVALVPDAPDLRSRPQFYRNATTDSDGNFRLNTIPPGSYKLFAWEWAAPDSWQNADFIRVYENLGRTLYVSPFGKPEKVQLNVIPRRK